MSATTKKEEIHRPFRIHDRNDTQSTQKYIHRSTFTCAQETERITERKKKTKIKNKRNETKYSICSAITNDYKSDCICTQSFRKIHFTKSTKRRSIKDTNFTWLMRKKDKSQTNMFTLHFNKELGPE